MRQYGTKLPQRGLVSKRSPMRMPALGIDRGFAIRGIRPDNVALYGDGCNSPFTAALLKHLADPELSGAP